MVEFHLKAQSYIKRFQTLMNVFNERSFSREDFRVWGVLRLGVEGVGSLMLGLLHLLQ